MKRTILAICGATVMAGLSAAAQTPQTPQPSTSAPPSSSQPSSTETVTLTGCVARGDGSASSPSSASGSSSAAAQYILTKAMKGTPTNPSSTSPARDTSAGAGAGATYVLKAEGSAVDFSKHVGHKVQLTGRMDSAMGTRDTSSSGAVSAAGRANMPAFKATNLTMVSSSCD